MPKVTYHSLLEKFIDKGFSYYEFHILVPQPMLFDPTCTSLSYNTREELLEKHRRITQEVYGSEWDYWNTWIDYQQYKF